MVSDVFASARFARKRHPAVPDLHSAPRVCRSLTVQGLTSMRRADPMVPANFPSVNLNAPINPMPNSSRLDGSGVATAGLIVRVLSPPPMKVPKLVIGPANPKLALPLQLVPENAVFTPEKPFWVRQYHGRILWLCSQRSQRIQSEVRMY